MQGATCRHRPSRHPQGPTELARQHADLAPEQRRETGRGAGPPRRAVGARRQGRPHVGGHGHNIKSPRCTQVRNSTCGKAHARRPRSTWTTRATRPSNTRRAPSKRTRNAALRTRHPGQTGISNTRAHMKRRARISEPHLRNSNFHFEVQVPGCSSQRTRLRCSLETKAYLTASIAASMVDCGTEYTPPKT